MSALWSRHLARTAGEIIPSSFLVISPFSPISIYLLSFAFPSSELDFYGRSFTDGLGFEIEFWVSLVCWCIL